MSTPHDPIRRRNPNEGADQDDDDEGRPLTLTQPQPFPEDYNEVAQPGVGVGAGTDVGRPEPVCPAWTTLTEGYIHRGIRDFNVLLAVTAAKYPKRCVLLVTLLSFGLLIIGFLTNFELLLSHEEIFTPLGSRPYQHSEWLRTESNFIPLGDFIFLIHANGETIINRDAVHRLFSALDTVRNVSGYHNLCQQSSYVNLDNEPACAIWSPTNFWHHNVTEFEATVKSDEDIQRTFSRLQFPDGTPVLQETVFGKFKAVNQTLVYNAIADQIFYYHHKIPFMIHIPLLAVDIALPAVDDAYPFQEELMTAFQEIRNAWKSQSPEDNPHNIQLEFFSTYGYEVEYGRALARDFPLVPVIFFVMVGFTCFIFHRYGMQQECRLSRATIGVASVVTIGMSMMSGFGLMFCVGIPFTNITLMAPFIILGVGLDDTFIITGTYFRKMREELEQGKKPINVAQSSKQDAAAVSSVSEDTASGNTQQPAGEGANEQKKRGEGKSSTGQLEQLCDHEVIEERVRATLEEVGLSISMTTITTATAFVLGCISSIPGIRWLCLYSSVTVVFDFVYQITFFVALLVLDERRVVIAQAKAMVQQVQQSSSSLQGQGQQKQKRCCNSLSQIFRWRRESADANGIGDHHGRPNSSVFVERFMIWYARKLIVPGVRNTILVACTVLLGVCIYSTTQLRQRFDAKDYVPKDSFVLGFSQILKEQSNNKLALEIYFRDVDQSDPKIQEQMRKYMYELWSLPEVGEPPDFCWVFDIPKVFKGDFSGFDIELLDHQQAEQALLLATTLQQGDYTFEEKMEIVLNIPVIRDVYGPDIVRNEKGQITASRCYLNVRDLDFSDVTAQVNFLFDQRAVSEKQPINQLPEHVQEWAFFAFSSFHPYWEVYAVSIKELVFTTIWGVVAVCAIGFIIIPHWSAVCFVGPLIVMLYFDLLGIMQFCGIYINAVTYVTVVISIGLLVDFLMHILLRYYETPGSTREQKVLQTLETMGASMMLGGFTTWLGVIPMAFSTTAVFMTLFISFFAMVSLGLLIGLAFLPAILSICGPVVCVSVQDLQKSQGNDNQNKTKESLSNSVSSKNEIDAATDIKPEPNGPESLGFNDNQRSIRDILADTMVMNPPPHIIWTSSSDDAVAEAEKEESSKQDCT